MNTTPNTPNAKAVTEDTPLQPEAIIEQLRKWQAQIPEFTQLPLEGAARLAGKNRLNPEFTQLALNAIDASPVMANAAGRSAADLRQELGEADRWTSVEDELKTLMNGIAAANRLRRQRVGLSLLQAYHFGLRVAKRKEYEALVPRVREMKRTPKFGVRLRTKAPEIPPEPQKTTP